MHLVILRDEARRNETAQENAPVCQFFLPMMRVRPILYVGYRA
jgi:hypothetical protein